MHTEIHIMHAIMNEFCRKDHIHTCIRKQSNSYVREGPVLAKIKIMPWLVSKLHFTCGNTYLLNDHDFAQVEKQKAVVQVHLQCTSR